MADDLRDQFTEALDGVTESDVVARGRFAAVPSPAAFAALVDAVLSVRDDEMERLRAELAEANERAERMTVLSAAVEHVRQHLAKIAHLAKFSPEAKVGELLPLLNRLLAALDLPEETTDGR